MTKAAERIIQAMPVLDELRNIRRTGGITPTADELVIAQKQLRQTVKDFIRDSKSHGE